VVSLATSSATIYAAVNFQTTVPGFCRSCSSLRKLAELSCDRLVTSAAFSPDNARVVTGSDSNNVSIWDASTGKKLLEFRGHDGAVRAAAFSRDGNRIVTGGVDGNVKVWNASTGQLLAEMRGRSGTVLYVEFALDGLKVLTGSDDNTARVWDVES
jgi:WD40 repeat protein